ncbi:glycosyltransferase family 2 protein [Winogradskyella alexanderae]|uniref:Glycosyltransferase n=1 Tax=Winogradskyella alexanderae TaxID=2877123 RepID=A0ABS7XQB8_9FLAO|nr:glycosyltransferase [Winogradskyella alexanderae]MCA0131589.1 glycosyltransferase [Winogradskyella alexanderae]
MTAETLFIIAILFYLLVMSSLVYGFDRMAVFKLSDKKAKTKFSVVIPFRNEAANLPALLQSLSELEYPKSHFEILLINDDSTDNSDNIINEFLKLENSKLNIDIRVISNIRNTDSPKKDAITLAAKKAKNDWILTTDADCILPKYWLDVFDEKIQLTDAVAIVGPITLIKENAFINKFQSLEILALQGATIGGFGIKRPLMCNGANFCYSKFAFYECGGFEGNTDIASGDDLFLLEKLTKRFKNKVHYLKAESAIVLTKPENTLKGLIQQRLRWTSKNSNYSNWLTKIVGLIVFMGNLSLIMLLPLVIFNIVGNRVAIALLVIKLSIDFLLLFKAARFFNRENCLNSFLLSSFIYPMFSVYIVFLSLFSSYDWKGRTFRK